MNRQRNNNRQQRPAQQQQQQQQVFSNDHLIGTTVNVVQKQDQGSGRLTNGIVAEVLTRSFDTHPHHAGLKVRLFEMGNIF